MRIRSSKFLILRKLYAHFGLKGIAFYLKFKFLKQNIIEFNYEKKFKHSIFLRKNSSDLSVFVEVILDEVYNIPIQIKPNVIIDCGANVGLTSLYFKNKFPDSKIIAIEPEIKNFEMMSHNLVKYENVNIYNNGIWSKKAFLEIVDVGKSNWGFTVKEVETKTANSISALSIKDLMEINNISEIDILKIDIEGSEKILFEKDYEYWLSKTNILIIELHDRLITDCSKTFFKAIVNYNFTFLNKGENLIFYLKK